jgi:Domain of unknown function (DUF3427)
LATEAFRGDPSRFADGNTVALEFKDSRWHLEPLGRRSGELQLWRSYSREEIPPLFGFEFSTAIGNAGFVKRPGHIFLLATLDKSGHGSKFQYKDHFISRNDFEWQSQNRTSWESTNGRDIRQHAEGGFVHLFRPRLEGDGPRWCGAVCVLRRRAVRRLGWRSTDYSEKEASG